MGEEYGSAKLVDEALKRRNKASVAKSFVKSANGAQILQGIKDEISVLLREITDKRLDRDEYIEKRAEVACLRKLLNGWETDAANVERFQQMYDQRARENAERIRLQAQAG